ncbi:MAG: capsular biosynthesis protein CpsI, partial [Bacteroidetes bacterium]|nr:capsular biosynthesis protein CpsI [Bacteroidota bacterium]
VTFADIDDLMEEVNFRPQTSLETGIQKFVDWYKDYYQV